jgi:hypothetical protein
MIRVFDMDGNKPQSHRLPVSILTDTEAEILGLGEVVKDGLFDDVEVIPEHGSVAYTADLKVGYLLSPSGVWTQFRG